MLAIRKLPRIGLEPTHLTAPEPKSGVSTNFTTWAQNDAIILVDYIVLKLFVNAKFIFKPEEGV